MNDPENTTNSVHDEAGHLHSSPSSDDQQRKRTCKDDSSNSDTNLNEEEITRKEHSAVSPSSEISGQNSSASENINMDTGEDKNTTQSVAAIHLNDILDATTTDQETGDINHDNYEQKNGTVPTKTALEQLDINKMFNVDSEKLLLNHSPIRVEQSSPEKTDGKNDNDTGDDDDGHPRKRLKLSSVPNLGGINFSKEGQSTQTNEFSTSPMAIEILSSNIHTSPNSREHISSTKTENPQTRGGTGNLSDSFSSSHGLSPVHDLHRGNESTNKLDIDSDNINGKILMVASRNNELLDEIHRTQKRISSLMQSYDQLNAKYHDQTSKFDILTRENEDLVRKVEDSERKNEQHIQNNQKLANELSKLKDEIDMANSNQNLLQSKFDSVCKEVDHWKDESESLLKTKTELQQQLSEAEDKLTKLGEEKVHVELKFNDMGNEKALLRSALDETTEQLESTRKEVIARDQQIVELNAKLDEYLNSEKGSSEDMAQLVSDLTDEKNKLERELQDVVLSKDDELKTLNNDLSELKNNLTALQSNLDSLSTERDSLKNELSKRDNELSVLNRLFDEANDECKVRYAEVGELKEKLVELKEEKESVDALNERLQSELDEGKKQLEEQKRNLQRVSLELEGAQDKESTAGDEHSKELQNLHNIIASLESTLEKNEESAERLREENKALQQQLEEKEKEYNKSNTERVSSGGSEVESEELQKLRETFDAQAKGQEEEVKSLRDQLLDLKQKLEQKDKDANKRLKLLAEDLYHQYSSKHEQKVRNLKKSYEKRYKLEIDRLTIEKDGFKEEIERLKKLLSSEREEKKELLRSMEAI